MASPGKSSDKQAAAPRQEAGEGSGAGGDGSPSRQQQTESTDVPSPRPPTHHVQGGETDTVANQTDEVPVPVPIPVRVTVTVVVPPEGGSSSRKRDRGESSAEGERRHKKKGELVEIPRGPPVCYVCNREFQSWKAVFGHMRAHKVGEERAMSGAFPPPVFTPPGTPDREQQDLRQQLVPTLLNIAQEVLSRPHREYAAAGSSTVPARRDIDLNVAFQPSPSSSAEPEPEPEPETSSSSTGGDKFNLNKPPKNGGDNDDKNAGAK